MSCSLPMELLLTLRLYSVEESIQSKCPVTDYGSWEL